MSDPWSSMRWLIIEKGGLDRLPSNRQTRSFHAPARGALVPNWHQNQFTQNNCVHKCDNRRTNMDARTDRLTTLCLSQPEWPGAGIETNSLATWRWKLHDPTSFSFDSMPACDGQTDRQPDIVLVCALHSSVMLPCIKIGVPDNAYCKAL